MVKTILHVEGFVVLGLSLYFYGTSQLSWALFFVLLFVPDLSAIGYFMNNRVGAAVYNFFHTYSLSVGCAFIGLMISNHMILAIGLIWTAHIGMDRMVGYGLKYPTEFKDTHLKRV